MTIDYKASTDEEFRKSINTYIKEQFADLLGDDIALLDLPNGLDLIQQKYGIGQNRKVA